MKRNGNQSLWINAEILKWIAIVVIIEIGMIHLLNAQAEYEEAAYMGYLFAGNFLGALIAAFGIYRKLVLGWVIGLAIAASSIAAYTWSRTLGMPGMEVEGWGSPYGIASLLLEGTFLVLFFIRPWRFPATGPQFVSRPGLGMLFPAAGLLIVVVLSGGLYRMDSIFSQGFGVHVGSIEQVRRISATSDAEMEEKYGIEVSRVATSMVGSIVDVRIKIVDPEKAHVFLQNQAALMVGDQQLILAPHLHSHTGSRLKAGKIFVVFFPTQQVVQPGTIVSLVFGSTRLEPVKVQ